MKNNSNYINFILTADKQYIVQLATTITSVLCNLNYRVTARFFLLTTDVSDEDLIILKKCKEIRPCEIIHIPVAQHLHFFNRIDISKFALKHVSLACYYRLLMFKVLPEDVDKCFYIDADIIVNTDLLPIYKQLQPNQMAAVVVENFAMCTRNNTLKHLKKIEDFKNFNKNPFKYPYFNAGFLLINIKYARKECIFEQCMQFLKENPNPPYADQDTLNAVIGQRYTPNILFLSPSYNVFCDFGMKQINWKKGFYNFVDMQEALLYPEVFHYAGSLKPWKTLAQNFNQIWWTYYSLSPYGGSSAFSKPKESWEKQDFYLFGCIPLVTILSKVKESSREKKCYLFRFFVLFKILADSHSYRFLLFNFIPLWQKKEHYEH